MVEGIEGKTIVMDCDGVLTDGTLVIDHAGEKLFKKFHTRDVRAIRELVYRGHPVVIVSADDWAGTSKFAEKVGAEFLALRDKSQVPYAGYIAVGDDSWDVGMLMKAAMAFAPSDADASVLGLPWVTTLPIEGGKGVIAALVRQLYF